MMVHSLGISLTFIYMTNVKTRIGGMELKFRLSSRVTGLPTGYACQLSLFLELATSFTLFNSDIVIACETILITGDILLPQSKILHYMRQMAVITPYSQFLFKFVSESTEYVSPLLLLFSASASLLFLQSLQPFGCVNSLLAFGR